MQGVIRDAHYIVLV